MQINKVNAGAVNSLSLSDLKERQIADDLGRRPYETDQLIDQNDENGKGNGQIKPAQESQKIQVECRKVVSNGLYNGAFLGDIQLSTDQFIAAIGKYESATGQKLDKLLLFQPFSLGLDFPAEKAKMMASRGGVLCIKLEPWSFGGENDRSFTLKDIAEGKFDHLIRNFAVGAAKAGVPVEVILFHEANMGMTYPWAIEAKNDPEVFKKAFRHVVRVMREAGGCNITFGYNVNIDFGNEASLYPGADVVDFVSVDGYNTKDYGGRYRSPSELFGPTISRVRQFNKPIYIGEFSCDREKNDPAGFKPRFLKESVSYFREQGLSGFFIFNLSKQEGGAYKDYGMDASSLKALKEAFAAVSPAISTDIKTVLSGTRSVIVPKEAPEVDLDLEWMKKNIGYVNKGLFIRTFGEKRGAAIWEALIRSEYIDKKGRLLSHFSGKRAEFVADKSLATLTGDEKHKTCTILDRVVIVRMKFKEKEDIAKDIEHLGGWRMSFRFRDPKLKGQYQLVGAYFQDRQYEKAIKTAEEALGPLEDVGRKNGYLKATSGARPESYDETVILASDVMMAQINEFIQKKDTKNAVALLWKAKGMLERAFSQLQEKEYGYKVRYSLQIMKIIVMIASVPSYDRSFMLRRSDMDYMDQLLKNCTSGFNRYSNSVVDDKLDSWFGLKESGWMPKYRDNFNAIRAEVLYIRHMLQLIEIYSWSSDGIKNSYPVFAKQSIDSTREKVAALIKDIQGILNLKDFAKGVMYTTQGLSSEQFKLKNFWLFQAQSYQLEAQLKLATASLLNSTENRNSAVREAMKSMEKAYDTIIQIKVDSEADFYSGGKWEERLAYYQIGMEYARLLLNESSNESSRIKAKNIIKGIREVIVLSNESDNMEVRVGVLSMLNSME